MVSQLARWKGPEVFLEAAALATRERADLEFRIVGEVLFPESEGADYAARLAARAGDLGLASRVRFTGPVPDARAWTGELDVLVHPAIRPEPFGRVLVEAMAAGIPVVATRSGAAEEIVAGGRTGILVPPGDARAIAGAVLDLAADPVRAAALGARGRERALAAFGIERTIGRVVSIYREILE